MRINNMPQITELMIRKLPSLYPLKKIDIGNNEEGISLIKAIENNISIIKQYSKGTAEELSEKLEIQIAIIEHGYKGIC